MCSRPRASTRLAWQARSADIQKRALRPTQVVAPHHQTVKVIVIIGMFVFSWVGWVIGEQISSDITWPFLVSGVGTIAGAFIGWYAAQQMNLK